MKKYLLLLAFIAVSSAVIAQDWFVEPNPAYGEANLDDWLTGPDDIVADAHITNNTSDTIFMRWERVVNIKPESWETAVCDVNLCYLPSASTKDFMLLPDSTGAMLVHAYSAMLPGGIPENGAVPGVATVMLKISNLNDPADTLIATYTFTLTGEPIVSISEVELEALKIYPNPASDYFRLTRTQEIQQLVVYNILGRQVQTFDIQNGKSYDISNLPSGVYLIAMIDKELDTVKTLRLQKH